MKWVRQHLILILINAAIALFVGVNVCGYFDYCETRDALESSDTFLQQDEVSSAALVETQGVIQSLLSRSFNSGGLKRVGERNLLSGLGNRTLLHMMGPWSGLLHGAASVAFVGDVVSPLADGFTKPKEYYVYTLERMLC